jgi:hypothetical protein
MKKKQKLLAENHKITNYISKQSKSGSKEEIAADKKLMEFFNKISEEDMKQIEDEA